MTGSGVRAMARGGVLASGPVAVVAVAGGWLAAGSAGLAGAAVGAGVAMVFFGGTVAIMIGTTRMDATLTTLLVAGGYVAQVLLLLVVARGARDLADVSRPALVVGVLAVSAAWLVGLSVAHVRTVRRSQMRR